MPPPPGRGDNCDFRVAWNGGHAAEMHKLGRDRLSAG